MAKKLNNNNLILIGMMGSGKSTIGKQLIEILQNSKNYKFADTDKLIEQKCNKTISDIFSELGEKKFRTYENQILNQLLEDNISNSIISTGGGIILKPENKEILRALGLVIWLHASTETILSRIKDDDSRPLLSNPNDEDSKQNKIEEILDSRFLKYKEAADLIIDVNDKTTNEICKEILQEVKNH